MKKLKIVFDWILRVGLSGVLVAFVIVAPFTLFPSLIKAEESVNRNEVYEYQGILELWHIETFEGGSVSRANFLEKEAVIFEKKHKGTYIVIQTMSLEQFELNLESGKKPNMLSFGIGIGDIISKDLIELDANCVRDDLKIYGMQGSKQLAVPYILGGYALISKNGDGMTGVGLNGTTNPLKVLENANKQIAKIYEDNSLDSYDAYDKFLKGNFGTLLGTQRDIYRVFNRQQKGLLTDSKFDFLGGYSDLIQYLSVFNGKDIEEKLCKEYVSQIISAETQIKLKDYNMFSTLRDLSLYDNGIYKDFEDILKQNLKSENAFISKDQIESQKNESYKNVVR